MKNNIKKMFFMAQKIQNKFPKFYLAGGTALMFKYQHRIRYDLDFFNEKPFSFNNLSYKIRKFLTIENEEKGGDNIDFFIDNIKISFVFFPFKNINKIEKYQEIKISSDYDIFLNKIYVAGRRIDIKDPFDIAFLFDKYKWNKIKIKKDFETKFLNQSFELYTGDVLNFTDYAGLDKKTKEILSKSFL